MKGKKLVAISCALSLVMTTGFPAAAEPTVKPQLLADDLTPDIGWWKFDETEGATAADSSETEEAGKKKYDAAINGATWTKGVLGNALEFNGESDYIVLNDYQAPATGEITYAAWVYMDTLNQYATVIKNWGKDTHGQMQIGLNRSGKMEAVFGYEDGKNQAAIADSVQFETGKWTHVAAVADGSKLVLYKDGQEIAQTSCTQNSKNDFPNLGIGAKPNDQGDGVPESAPGYLDGKLDDVRIYSKALSAEQVQSLYMQAIPERIQIADGPEKTVYKRGEALDITGLKVEAVTGSGTIEEVPLKDCVISGFTADTPGEKTITVTYMDKTATFTVTVVEEIADLEPDLGWWKMDETEGTVAFDSTTHKNNAAVNGGTWMAGLADGALKMNGEGDFAIAKDYEKPETTATYSAWVYADAASVFGTIVKNWSTSTKGQIELGLDKAGTKMYAQIRESDGGEVKVSDENEFPLNQWVLVTAVMDGKDLILYENGEEIGRKAYDGTLMTTGYQSLGIGVKPNGEADGADESWPGFWNGRIDDVRIYGRSLSAGAVKVLYETLLPECIEIVKMPKTEYLLGDEFDLTGIEVKATYAEGSTKQIPLSDCKIEGYNSLTLGEQTITISYMNKEATFKVTVGDREVDTVEVTKNPKKLVYALGADFDSTGMELTVTFKDGFKMVLPSDLVYGITGYDKDTAGKQEVTATTEFAGRKVAVKISVTVKKPDLPLKVTEANDWTALLDRNGEEGSDGKGWLQADGIYSIPLTEDDRIGSAAEDSKTLFIYSDSRIGKENQETLAWSSHSFVNHSAGLLDGNTPKHDEYHPVYGKNGSMSYNNMFDTKWLMDGVTIGDTIYIFGLLTGENWRTRQIDIVKVPIDREKNEPDFANYEISKNVPLVYYTGGANYTCVFGSGIMANTKESGAPNPDGYIYVYGYRIYSDMNSQPLVSRVKPEDFAAEKYENWEFWTGSEWSHDVKDTECEEAVIGPMHVSNECSVTPVTTGPYAGKYMMVYCRGGQSSTLEYSIADSPAGPFSEGIAFYNTQEHDMYGTRAYTYNAKAHPALSREGHLLVSYNHNNNSGTPTTDQYRPRFVEIDLNELAKKPVLANVSTHVKTTASGYDSKDTHPMYAVDEIWFKNWKDSTPGDKWLELDLGQTYYLSRYIVKNDGWGSDKVTTTRDWKFQISNDGEDWTTVDEVAGNTKTSVTRTFAEIKARYVRLYITTPTQNGEDVARLDNIMVYGTTEPVAPETRENVALNKPVTASGGQGSAPALVDGKYSNIDNDKWCCTDKGDKWITVDLEGEYTIGRYVLRNAGMVEAPKYNTNTFTLQASMDGNTWTDIDHVKGNMLGINDKEVEDFNAHYVRLYVTKPTLSTNDVTRIYELELYGTPKKQESKPVETIFEDVHADDWFVENVQYVYDQKYMTGIDAVHFGSALDLCRAQFATILYRMEGCPEVTYDAEFPDVPKGTYYSDAVAWASSADVGIINGYTDGENAGKFGPADDINREQLVSMLYRYARYKGFDISQTSDMADFPDKDSISGFAKEAFGWAVANGLIKGEQGRLNPQGSATRVECAAIIQRFMENVAR